MRGGLQNMRWIKIALGGVIAVSVLPIFITTVNDLTGSGGELEGTVAGTLLELAPIVFVAGVLGFLFVSTGTKNMD